MRLFSGFMRDLRSPLQWPHDRVLHTPCRTSMHHRAPSLAAHTGTPLTHIMYRILGHPPGPVLVHPESRPAGGTCGLS